MTRRLDPATVAALDRFEAAFRQAIREPLMELLAELAERQSREAAERSGRLSAGAKS